jgi:hypothetical protein
MDLYFIIGVGLYFFFSYLASVGWKNRNLNQMYGFLLGLFTSPLGSYVICLALNDNKDKVKEEMLEEMHEKINMLQKQNLNNKYLSEKNNKSSESDNTLSD